MHAPQDAECSCKMCVSLCHRAPGWFAPDEAREAIKAGLAGRLMLDYWIKVPDDVYVLAPAAKGCEKDRAPNTEELFGGMSFVESMFANPKKGTCTFLRDGRCDIHASGMKPLQCRSAMGCKGTGLDNTDMGKLWDNPEAQALVFEWMALVGLSEDVLEDCT